MRLYKESAERYEFAGDCYVLAAVGKIESNHGEIMGPSGAGTMGPMPFLPSTWSSYGVDGNGDGEANIVDPEDAIPAAAACLRAGGAPDDWYAALFAYNRAGWYVEEVLAIAESYRRVHGDDNVGPYMKTSPSQGAETAPTIEPPPRPEKTLDEREERQPERTVEGVSPAGEESEANDDSSTPDEETNTEPGSTEPESPAAEDGKTTEKYQYQGAYEAYRRPRRPIESSGARGVRNPGHKSNILPVPCEVLRLRPSPSSTITGMQRADCLGRLPEESGRAPA